MLRFFQVILLCYISLVVFLLFDYGEANQENNSGTKHPRQRRFLGFRNVSRFFVRLNFKANMVPWNQLFAQAVGFRVNYDDPPENFYPYHHLQRRTVYRSLETLLDRNGMNGYNCVCRAICETRKLTYSGEIYHRILKIIFRQQSSATDLWHKLTTEECEAFINSCPFSMLDILQYTDNSLI